MPRALAAVILATGVSIAVLAGGNGLAGAVAPTPPSTPPTSTVAATTPPSTPTANAPVIVARRGGAAAGSIIKPVDKQWSVRQMATTVGLCVVALAAAGYAYGRIRSTPPRHPDLVRSPD